MNSKLKKFVSFAYWLCDYDINGFVIRWQIFNAMDNKDVYYLTKEELEQIEKVIKELEGGTWNKR